MNVALRQPLSFRFFLALLAAALFVTTASGQEFRMDTEVFVGKEKEPIAETLTIFTNGLIYDFLLNEPKEITLFDPVRQGFTLLDPARRMRCNISTQEALSYMLALDSHAAQSQDPLFAFAAMPAFITTAKEYEESGQTFVSLTLAGKPLEYLAIARTPENSDAVRAFRNFADWYARLNAMRPGNLPPGARLELNKALAERDLIPVEITRTITPPNPLARKIEMRSRHLVNWSLSGEDRKRIQRTGTMLAEFPSVSFDQYRLAGAPATGKDK
ncbi:MAG: hypothetical protein WD872_13240 [Pirellulaceae bacterium]